MPKPCARCVAYRAVIAADADDAAAAKAAAIAAIDEAAAYVAARDAAVAAAGPHTCRGGVRRWWRRQRARTVPDA